MKTLFTFLFLTACIQGMGQTKKDNFICYSVSSKDWHPTVRIMQRSDTLEISEPLQIHFIKIGTEVYQIVQHPATIEKVTDKPFRSSPSGMGIYYYSRDSILNKIDKLKKP